MLIGLSGKIGSGKDTVAKMIQYWIFTYKHNSVEEFRDDSSENYSSSGWEVKRFAGKLKLIVAFLTGIPVKDLEKQEVKDSQLSKKWWFYWHMEDPKKPILSTNSYSKLSIHEQELYVLKKPTVRWLLQILGTDAMRNVVHPDVHVNALFADYTPVDPEKRVATEDGWDYSACTWPNWIISDMRFLNEMGAIQSRKGFTVRVNRSSSLSNSTHLSETELDNEVFDWVIDNNAGIPELLEEVRKMLIYFKIINE